MVIKSEVTSDFIYNSKSLIGLQVRHHEIDDQRQFRKTDRTWENDGVECIVLIQAHGVAVDSERSVERFSDNC